MSEEPLDRVQRYDLIHRGSPGDVNFYLEACPAGARVLELGCGTGRHLRGLAGKDCAVTGLDFDLDRLDVARGVAPGAELVFGDMGSFVLPERFDRVLIPYNGLFALGSENHILCCLRRSAEHLAPGGELLLDVYAVDDQTEAGLREPRTFEPLTTLVVDGRTVEVWERMVAGPEPSTIEATYRYEWSGGRVEDMIPHRYVRPDRLLELVAVAGLSVQATWGDFMGAPFDADSAHLVVQAERVQEVL